MEKKAGPALMRMLPTGSKRGFTMLELLVTLVIMTLMSGVVMTAIGPALAEARVRAGARMIIAQLRYARSLAVTSRQTVAVSFDNDRHGLSVMTQTTDSSGNANWQSDTTQAGRFRTLPDEVSVANITLNDTSTGATAGTTGPVIVNPFTTAPTTSNTASDAPATGQMITFTPLGEGEDAQITLRDTDGHERIMQVDAITGRCELVNSNGAQTVQH